MKNYRNIEEVIISSLLNNPDLIFTKLIEPRWFQTFRKTIVAMQSVASSGAEVDVFSVSEAMGNPGAMKALAEIQLKVHGSRGSYPSYLEKLSGYFESNSIHDAIKKADRDIDEGEEPKSVITGLIAESMKISSADGKASVYNAKEAMSAFINQLDEIYEARETGGTGLKTGISALDDSMGGMHPSDMAIVGARPGVGKTAFAVSVMRNVARTGKRVGFFSTEMSVFQVMSRFVSIESNINAHKLRQADFDDAGMDFSRITAATSSLMGLDLRICDKPAITIGELSMQARAWHADGGIDFVVVDYLTRLHPDKTGFNQNLDVGFIVTGLKNLARNLNIPVMVLAQLNRSGAQRKDKRPVMSDLRDSGIIEQEADQILMLYRPTEDEEGVEREFSPEIILEKNRHGECGIVRCEFEPTTMHWRDMQHNYAHQQEQGDNEKKTTEKT